jgi:hypothetical protein
MEQEAITQPSGTALARGPLGAAAATVSLLHLQQQQTAMRLPATARAVLARGGYLELLQRLKTARRHF